MHQEWLAQLTPEEISAHPDFVMDRYFLTNEQPDATKTSAVVGIPFDPHSVHRAGQLREAASTVSGLHQATGQGQATQTVFLGWNKKAVTKAANGHAGEEAKAVKAADEERETERAEEHADYLKTLNRNKGPKKHSPVGSYMIDCEEIETQWPSQADDMTMHIFETGTPGIFEASFEFGVVEGAMILSTDIKSLEEYMAELEQHEESEEDDYDEDDEDDEDEDAGEGSNKRKAATSSSQPRGRGRPAKKAKTTSLKFHLRARGRETGEGEIFFDPEEGSIKFENEKMAKFSGVITLPCVGEAVPFTGRKTTDQVHGGSSWAEFSYAEYEDARVSRWL
ncbi:hypothetical protein GGR57DRAFT_464669 [Xylariaceae sp. FL1272]|nr:hypothetical protein GGR57DRAFT_464669 [Xylariaceae sp. FL1272]